MRDILGHKYRVREDGTRQTKTTRPLRFPAEEWFKMPPEARKTYLDAEASASSSSRSKPATPGEEKILSCAALGLEGLEGKTSTYAIQSEPDAEEAPANEEDPQTDVEPECEPDPTVYDPKVRDEFWSQWEDFVGGLESQSYALPARVGKISPNKLRHEFAMPRCNHYQKERQRDKLSVGPNLQSLVVRPVGKQYIEREKRDQDAAKQALGPFER